MPKRRTVQHGLHNISKRTKNYIDVRSKASGEVSKLISDEVDESLQIKELSDLVGEYARPGANGFFKKEIVKLNPCPVFTVSDDKDHFFTRHLFSTKISKWSSETSVKECEFRIYPEGHYVLPVNYGDSLEESEGRLYTVGDKKVVTVSDSKTGALLLEVGQGVLDGPTNLCVNNSHIIVADKERISIFSKDDGAFVKHLAYLHSSSPPSLKIQGDELFVLIQDTVNIHVFNLSTGNHDRTVVLRYPYTLGFTVDFEVQGGFTVDRGEIFTSQKIPGHDKSIFVHSAKDGCFLRSWKTGATYINCLHAQDGTLWSGQFCQNEEKTYFRLVMYE
jgi:hypothetical protein